jgi:hypothetical protein
MYRKHNGFDYPLGYDRKGIKYIVHFIVKWFIYGGHPLTLAFLDFCSSLNKCHLCNMVINFSDDPVLNDR